MKDDEEEEKSDIKTYKTIKNSFTSKRPSSAVRNSAPEDNFSSASFKSAKSNFTLENDLISKDNIVYQKYMYFNIFLKFFIFLCNSKYFFTERSIRINIK